MNTKYCQICLEPMPDAVSGDGVSVLLACGHKFHVNCMAQWMHTNTNPKCPLCRNMISLHDQKNVNQNPTRIVQIKGDYNSVLVYKGPEGTNRLVELRFPSGETRYYDGENDNERLVRVEFPNGQTWVYNGDKYFIQRRLHRKLV